MEFLLNTLTELWMGIRGNEKDRREGGGCPRTALNTIDQMGRRWRNREAGYAIEKTRERGMGMSETWMSRRSMLKRSAAGSAFLAIQPVFSKSIVSAGKADKKLRMLISGLCSEDPLIQAHCATLLGQLKSMEAVEPLMGYVLESRYYAKTAGLNALMEMRDPRALRAVLPLIKDPRVPIDRHWMHSVVVQSAAAFTALLLGRPEGIEYFKSHKDLARGPTGEQVEWGVGTFCIWYAPYILRLTDTGPDLGYMKELVKVKIGRKNQYHPNQVVQVAEALGVLKGRAAAEELKWYLMAFQSRYIRGAAAQNLLVAEASPENLSLVQGAYRSDPCAFVRIKAGAGLMAAGETGPVDYICDQAASAGNIIDRTAALAALGQIKHSAGKGILLNSLRHKDSYVRLCTVEALEASGAGVQEVKALFETDPDPRVRQQAAKYLLVQEGRV